jgi:hypothetical protein
VTLTFAALILLGGFGIHRFYWQQILAAKEIYLPRILPKAVDQKMGFCTASDGVHIAYVPLESGRELAGLVPGARMVVIEGRDHIPVPGDGELEQLVPAVASFLDEDLEVQKVNAPTIPSSP